MKQQAGKTPACQRIFKIVAGDFNDSTERLRFLTQPPHQLHDAYQLLDSKGTCSRFTYASSSEPQASWPVINGVFHSANLQPISLLVKSKADVMPNACVIPNSSFPSDHLPVGCKFNIASPVA